MSDLEYLTKDGVTSELIEAESERYERWDDALNEIYGVLKTQLSESEMNALREKQRAWIAYRDRTANEKGAKFAGGSAEPLAYIGTMATLTEERCYELVGDYMK